MNSHLLLDLLVWGLGTVGAFASALLGVGGAIVMLPLLLYLPPLVGLPALSVQTATGLATCQVLFAAILGTLAHRRYGLVNRTLVVSVAPAMTVASLVAALFSGMVPSRVLVTIFAAVATVAGATMFWPAGQLGDEPLWSGTFSRPLAVLIGVGAGILVGLIGSGTFILAPAFIHLLRVPARVTIGSTLGVAILAALAATLGKAAAGLVSLELATAVLLGTVPGAFLGAYVSRRLPPRLLRYLLAGLIILIALRAWWDLLR
jgi:uncharacterized membrane protein YfcA